MAKFSKIIFLLYFLQGFIYPQNENIEFVAVNDLTDAETLAHLFKYDSTYGVSDKSISVSGKFLVVNKKRYPILAEADPAKLPWKKMKVDVVLECTGIFRTRGMAAKHTKDTTSMPLPHIIDITIRDFLPS